MSTDQAARNITAASQGSTRVSGSIKNSTPGSAPADQAIFQAMLQSLDGEISLATDASSAAPASDPLADVLTQDSPANAAGDTAVRPEDLLLQWALLGWTAPGLQPEAAGRGKRTALDGAAGPEEADTAGTLALPAVAAQAAGPARPGWTTLAAQRSARLGSPSGADINTDASANSRASNGAADSALALAAGAAGAANPGQLLVQAGAALATLAGGERAPAATRDSEILGESLGSQPWAEQSALARTDRVAGVAASDASLRVVDGAAQLHELGAAALDAVPDEAQLAHADIESLAEQISLWVSQGVNEAELRLDGSDQAPVEVSIAVRGLETSVAFRSDQASTRDALERALGVLQDQLRSQGLALASVSVGDFASGGRSDGHAHSPTQGGQTGHRLSLRPDAADATRTAPAAALARGGNPQGVDVFV